MVVPPEHPPIDLIKMAQIVLGVETRCNLTVLQMLGDKWIFAG